MNTARASSHELRASPNGRTAPIVFVVDGDDSVRQSLELLIQGEGWQPEVFACAQEPCLAHEYLLQAAWYWTLLSQTLMVSIYRSSSPIGLKCRSSSSRPTPMCARQSEL